ncbi:MAG: YraN family protein [Pseudomonadota bacterium]
MSLRHQSGLAAEEAAVALYEARGGVVQARRLRTPLGEIDLIVLLGPLAVFVEVKRQRRTSPDSPISERQWQRIAAAAEIWRAEHAPLALCRFDAVLVDGAGHAKLIEDAWRPGW